MNRTLRIHSRNGKLRALISKRGGELMSLQRLWKGRWIELIYRSSRGWQGGAPWLFPAVGRNFVGNRLAWNHAGHVYPMPIHGFLKLCEWVPLGLDRSGTSAAFALSSRSAPSCRRSYPFDFFLETRFKLTKDELRCRFIVQSDHNNREAMPFSIGNHLTLRAPLTPDSSAEDCLVRTPARTERWLDRRGLLSGRTGPARFIRPASIWGKTGQVDRVLGDLPRGRAEAEFIDPAGLGVRISQQEIAGAGQPARARPEEFHFVFYGDRQAGFLCPEPWLGRPNSLNDRRGIVRLEPGGRFVWEMTISFSSAI